MDKIATCLWFNGRAEEAANYYVSLFKDSQITGIARLPTGTVLTVRFVLKGSEYVALNGGPNYKFTPAISFVLNCDTQAEVDDYWQKLLDGGGQENRCGWLTDKFGVSWQVVPKAFIAMLTQSNNAASQRAIGAMLTMKKLDMALLQKAYDNA